MADEDRKVVTLARQPFQQPQQSALADVDTPIDEDTVELFDKFLDMAERGEIQSGIALSFDSQGTPMIGFRFSSKDDARGTLLKFSGLLAVVNAQLTEYLLAVIAPPAEEGE